MTADALSPSAYFAGCGSHFPSPDLSIKPVRRSRTGFFNTIGRKIRNQRILNCKHLIWTVEYRFVVLVSSTLQMIFKFRMVCSHCGFLSKIIGATVHLKIFFYILYRFLSTRESSVFCGPSTAVVGLLPSASPRATTAVLCP